MPQKVNAETTEEMVERICRRVLSEAQNDIFTGLCTTVDSRVQAGINRLVDQVTRGGKMARTFRGH